MRYSWALFTVVFSDEMDKNVYRVSTEKIKKRNNELKYVKFNVWGDNYDDKFLFPSTKVPAG